MLQRGDDLRFAGLGNTHRVVKNRIQAAFKASAELKLACMDVLAEPVEQAAAALVQAFRGGNKLLIFGNGGSAADAQHIAAELINKYSMARPSLPAIALTTDSSALTSIANDESYEEVFSKQVEGLARGGDVVIGITTSGRSPNVIRGLIAARDRGAKTIAFSGKGGGPVTDHADIAIVVPHDETARIQEVHILCGHVLCQLVDEEMFGVPADDTALA